MGVVVDDDGKKKRTVSIKLLSEIGRFIAEMQKAQRRDDEVK